MCDIAVVNLLLVNFSSENVHFLRGNIHKSLSCMQNLGGGKKPYFGRLNESSL